jgi:molybdopterin synthase catalytic subunit
VEAEMGRWICEEPLDLNELLRETEDPGSGALVVFVGTVRDENDGKPVEALTYEAHIPLAEKALEELECDVLSRFDVRRCRIRHRIGTLPPGEPSVVVVIRAAHRAEAFAAARYAIDELKERVPIWKEEHYASGESRYPEGVPLRGK